MVCLIVGSPSAFVMARRSRSLCPSVPRIMANTFFLSLFLIYSFSSCCLAFSTPVGFDKDEGLPLSSSFARPVTLTRPRTASKEGRPSVSRSSGPPKKKTYKELKDRNQADESRGADWARGGEGGGEGFGRSARAAGGLGGPVFGESVEAVLNSFNTETSVNHLEDASFSPASKSLKTSRGVPSLPSRRASQSAAHVTAPPPAPPRPAGPLAQKSCYEARKT
jgi:hypothetical protein